MTTQIIRNHNILLDGIVEIARDPPTGAEFVVTSTGNARFHRVKADIFDGSVDVSYEDLGVIPIEYLPSEFTAGGGVSQSSFSEILSNTLLLKSGEKNLEIIHDAVTKTVLLNTTDDVEFTGNVTAMNVYGNVHVSRLRGVHNILESTSQNLILNGVVGEDGSETLQLGTNEHLVATSFTGNGSQLVKLNADALESGTLSCGLFPRDLQLQGSLAIVENVFIQGSLYCSDVRLYGTSDMPVPPTCPDVQKQGSDTQTSMFVQTLEADNVQVANSISIGSSTPIAPLHISGSVPFEDPGFMAYIRPDPAIGVVTGIEHFDNLNVAIYTEGAVVATTFAGLSDARVKTDVRSKESMLDVVDAIRPITYRYKDHVHHGSSRRLGVIAQDLHGVLPECVSRHASAVPSVWRTANARQSSVDPSHTCIRFDDVSLLSPKPVDPRLLPKGAVVRLVTANPLPGVRDVRITRGLSSDNDLGFDVDLEDVRGDVFVYGTLESDVMTVEYDGLAVVACGAIRELHDKVKMLETMIHK